MGLVSLMVMVKIWVPCPWETGWKPLLMAVSDKGTHGFSKLDWVTVWFNGLNQKLTFSPTFGFKVSGSKASFPPAPTWTLRSAPECAECDGEAAAEVVVAISPPPPYCASAAGRRNEMRYAERIFVGLFCPR